MRTEYVALYQEVSPLNIKAHMRPLFGDDSLIERGA
jgi:hypothetical protein